MDVPSSQVCTQSTSHTASCSKAGAAPTLPELFSNSQTKRITATQGINERRPFHLDNLHAVAKDFEKLENERDALKAKHETFTSQLQECARSIQNMLKCKVEDQKTIKQLKSQLNEKKCEMQLFKSEMEKELKDKKCEFELLKKEKEEMDANNVDMEAVHREIAEHKYSLEDKTHELELYREQFEKQSAELENYRKLVVSLNDMQSRKRRKVNFHPDAIDEIERMRANPDTGHYEFLTRFANRRVKKWLSVDNFMDAEDDVTPYSPLERFCLGELGVEIREIPLSPPL